MTLREDTHNTNIYIIDLDQPLHQKEGSSSEQHRLYYKKNTEKHQWATPKPHQHHHHIHRKTT
jgi:hypothetical protein